ncbi:hypothetical protein STENM36S_07174 [Streptomyces tendae]
MALKITVIGTGYLGATHAAAMAELGFEVLGLDVVPEKIEMLQRGEVPMYEPRLQELLRKPSPNWAPSVLDCPDPRALARFYAGVLGGTVEGEGDWVDRNCRADRRWRSRPPPGSCRRSGPRPTTRSSSTSTSK